VNIPATAEPAAKPALKYLRSFAPSSKKTGLAARFLITPA
jgi:hypothetical protein